MISGRRPRLSDSRAQTGDITAHSSAEAPISTNQEYESNGRSGSWNIRQICHTG